jgi:hypothetical protein
MPDFEVVGRGKDTNRRRKRIYQAPSEEEARLEAARDGTIPDQITLIHEGSPTPATHSFNS